MKKIIVLMLVFLLSIFNNHVYAEEGYSEWSTTPSGYPNEEEAIQYGVILPKLWSEWDIYPSTDPINQFFQKSEDFGSSYYVQSASGDEDFRINSAKAQTLYTWDFGEPKMITNFTIDVDCSDRGGGSNYYAPSMHLFVDGVEKGYKAQERCSDGSENWYGCLNVVGQVLVLTMDDCSGDGRYSTHIRYSYVCTEKIMYSYVIEWDEPINWRFDSPYDLKGGAESQKPAERKVYRYPLKPIISVNKRYLYEDSTFESVKELASALDYNGDDITNKIVITQIQYDDTGSIDNYPDYFNPYISDSIHVTYYVRNDVGGEDFNNVKLYILRDGEAVDFEIYDRYISREYLNTLKENSKWKSEEFNEILNNAFNWLERK